jgi:hypothetical protein
MSSRGRYLGLALAALLPLAAGCDTGALWPFGGDRDAAAERPTPVGRTEGDGDAATGPLAGALGEYEFVIEIGGRRRSEGSRARRRVSHRGLNCFETVTRQRTTRVRDDEVFERVVRRRVITGPHMEAMRFHEVVEEGGTRRELVITVENGVAEFESFGEEMGKGQIERVPVPGGVLFSLNAPWLAMQELEPDRTFRAAVLSQRLRRVVEERARILRMTEVEFRGRRHEAWVAEVTSEASPDQPVQMTFTGDGQLLRMDSAGAAFRVLDGSVEEEPPAEPDEVVTAVPLDPQTTIPAWDTYDRMLLAAEPGEAWLRHVGESEYVRPRQEEGRTLLALRRVPSRDQKVPAAPFPVQDLPPGLVAFTRAGGNLMPNHETIQRIARRITEQESDALMAVAYLAGWVNENIKWNARGRLNTSPVETLKSMRGDCGEHADLFASLARAVGFPTRHCLGLLVKREEAVYHAWVEVYIGGVWVPVDTTVNRVGLPAGYILTARDSDGTGQLRDSLPWAMKQNKLGLRALELHRRGHTVVPDQKGTYVAVEDDWLANLYWGFALTKPTEWLGRIRLRSVEITSPDGEATAEGFAYGTATVKVEAQNAEYRVTEGELAALRRSLDRNMSAFRENESRLDTLANNPALFLDFTCEVGGESMRCWFYIVPRSGRSYRVTCWAPTDSFGARAETFADILENLEF